VRFEPGVERIEFDGPFATGPTGRTVAARLATELDPARRRRSILRSDKHGRLDVNPG